MQEGRSLGAFLWFSVHLWLSRACIRVKFPHNHQELWLILSHWLTRLLSPLVSISLSATAFLRLSLTPLFCWLLWDLAFPCLLPVSSEISRTSPLCGFRTKADKGILTHIHRNKCTHIVPQQKWVPAHLRMLSKKCVYKSYIYLIYMYKEDLALNNLQRLICHKTQLNQYNKIALSMNY